MSEQQPHCHIPYGEDGACLYSDSSECLYKVAENLTPFALRALAEMTDNGRHFTICDYGTADGGTSMYLVRDVIGNVKKRNGAEKEIHVIYEDQPVNDFKSLFLRLNGFSSGPKTFLQQYSHVFISAVGTGFYRQVVPSSSVDLGISMTAFHWLSKVPGKYKHSLHHTTCKDTSELEVFSQQATRDWEEVLVQRSKEIRPGGQLVVASNSIDDEGQLNGCSKNSKRGHVQTCEEIWLAMEKEGKITREEFVNTNLTSYWRTTAENLAPFNDPNSRVSRAGLRLAEWETKLTRCPYQLRWRQSGKKEDLEARRRHAKEYIPNVRIWTNHTFMSGLSDDRPLVEREKIVDEFYQRYEDLVSEHPDDFCCDIVHCYMRIVKGN